MDERKVWCPVCVEPLQNRTSTDGLYISFLECDTCKTRCLFNPRNKKYIYLNELNFLMHPDEWTLGIAKFLAREVFSKELNGNQEKAIRLIRSLVSEGEHVPSIVKVRVIARNVLGSEGYDSEDLDRLFSHGYNQAILLSGLSPNTT